MAPVILLLCLFGLTRLDLSTQVVENDLLTTRTDWGDLPTCPQISNLSVLKNRKTNHPVFPDLPVGPGCWCRKNVKPHPCGRSPCGYNSGNGLDRSRFGGSMP
jgi:hypothetical protein